MALKLRKVDYTKKGHIAYVTIRNAEHENCLEEEIDHDLWKVWHDFRDDPRLYVAILTGEGNKSFCAGSDLRAYVERIANRSPEWNRRRAHEGPNLGGITKGIAVWKHRAFIDAHRYDHARITTLLLVTTEETRLEDLLARKVATGDLGATANTIVALGSERVGNRLARMLCVVKHRGSAKSDEIVEFRIGANGLEM